MIPRLLAEASLPLQLEIKARRTSVLLLPFRSLPRAGSLSLVLALALFPPPNRPIYLIYLSVSLSNGLRTSNECFQSKQNQADPYWQRYNVLKRNCNHFTREMASRLGLAREYDEKIHFKFPGFSIAK